MLLARNIRYLRRKQGIGQEDLAQRLGYKSYTTIQKWESGVSEPPLKVLHALSEIFGEHISRLTTVDIEMEESALFQRMVEETVREPAVEWYSGLSDEQRELVNLLAYLPSGQVEALLNLAKQMQLPRSQETE